MSTGPTPGRQTVLTLDEFLPGVVTPWTAIQRSAGEMARSTQAEKTNVELTPGVGWRLKSYVRDSGDARELTAAQPGLIAPSNSLMAVATGFSEVALFRKTSVPGASYAADVQDEGFPMLMKRVGDGESFADHVLSADQAAFSSPNPGEDSEPLDRVGVSTENHLPWDPVKFFFYVPGSAVGTARTIETFYFSGPAGCDREGASDSSKAGTGKYAIKVRLSGVAYLYERLVDATWRQRFSFEWSPGDRPSRGDLCTIEVASDAYDAGTEESSDWRGSRLVFFAGTLDRSRNVTDVVASFAAYATRASGRDFPIYNVPRVGAATTVPDRLRVDMARTVRGGFAVYRHVYAESGVLFDDVISVDAPLTGTEPVVYAWKAYLPPGTSLLCQMYDARTGAELTPEGPAASVGNVYRRAFDVDRGARHFRVKFSFQSSPDRLRTPTLVGGAIRSSPVYQDEFPLATVTIPQRSPGLALPRTTISSLSVSKQTNDPNEESASFEVVDLTGELEAKLGPRTMVPIKADVLLPGDRIGSQFRGYIRTAEGQPGRRRTRGGVSVGYPNGSKKRRYNLSATGEWARLYESVAQRRYDWNDLGDFETGQNWLVTAVVRNLLLQVYPDECVDVPDKPITLYGSVADAMATMPGARIGEAARSYLEDWLGAYLLFDPSAGAKGMWRALYQKSAPYKNLCVFELEPTAYSETAVPRLSHVPGSYPPTTVGESEVTTTFILAGSLTHWWEKAEGNLVTVIGAAVGDDAAKAGTQDGALLTQVAVKTDSYNAFALAPEHARYPDGSAPEYRGVAVPIKVVDFRLTTQEAVDTRCRRIYDRACWARYYLRFTAPLQWIWDDDDPQQQRWRTLRYYDPVLIRDLTTGELRQFLVVDARESYRKDSCQYATYTVVTQGNIDTIGTMPYARSAYSNLIKGLGRAYGTGFAPPIGFASQAAATSTGISAIGFPEIGGAPIQDLDPDSPTFGEFVGPTAYAY
jgi:hypothetical protein